jgi:pyridoxal 5'-phosphate synthase pdxT subunit
MKVGVLALQGAFIEHVSVLQRMGIEAVEVRLPNDLKDLGGLIIPGGESTTILKLMHDFELYHPLKKMIGEGFPVWGTCAGMICLAQRVFNSQESILEPLEVMDIEVKRNAFGRQVDSFEIDLAIPALGDRPFHAVFIRAPFIEKAEPQVDILAKLPNGVIVAARQKNLVATSFHPELTDDFRFHEYFANMINSRSPIKNKKTKESK